MACKTAGKSGPIHIGKFLKQRREYMGMSRETLASAVGTTYNTIRLYEEGLRIMRVDRLCELLEALGLGVLDCFSIKTGAGVSISPETLHLAERLEAVNGAAYPGLVRQIHALIDVAES